MFSSSLIFTTGLALAAVAAGAAVPSGGGSQQSENNTDGANGCAKGYYILTVGGTGCGDASMNSCEVGDVAQQVIKAVPGSVQKTIGYSASGDFSQYATSLNTGIQPLQQHIQDYAKKCPKGKIVLMGYSQGAQVVTDTLAGDGGDGTGAHPLDKKLHDNIHGVVVWADPSFNYQAGKAISKGTARGHGTSARSDASYKHLNEFKGKMESWCDEHDTYCSPTPPVDGSVHTSYFQQDHYISQSVDFVKHLGHGKGGKGTGGQGEKTDKTQ